MKVSVNLICSMVAIVAIVGHNSFEAMTDDGYTLPKIPPDPLRRYYNYLVLQLRIPNRSSVRLV